MNRRNLLLLLPFFLLLLLVVVAILCFRYFQPENDDPIVEHFDLFLYSSYYFPESKSLGNNALAVVFTADYELMDYYPKLEVRAFSESETRLIESDIKLITPHQKCKWVDYYAIVEGIPNMTKVAIKTGDSFFEIPFSVPSTAFHEVVSCIAPLFASEQWQVAILAAHTYKRFGSHMHLYTRSMVTPLFELLKEYEQQGYLTFQPWYRIQLNSVSLDNFNPNINVEFRNQAAAQTDCLLQYKEKASFVSFVDLDDILIPRLGSTYFDEFDEIFNKFPLAAYLFYEKANTRAVTSKSSANFALSNLIYSIEFQQKMETGKVVARPKYINASWIHWPPSLPRGMFKYSVPYSTNAIIHLKEISRNSEIVDTKILPLYEPFKDWNFEPKYLLSREDLDAISNDFQKMQSIPRVKELMTQMPENFFYLPLISSCYHDFYKFYYSGQLQRLKCFGPERCQFPQSPGISCYNADVDYHSRDGSNLSIHFGTMPRFKKEDGCIR